MATIKEIQKMLKSDPTLIDRIPNLREFVNHHREDFAFLFDKKSNSNKNRSVDPIEQEQENKRELAPKKWSPKIESI